MKRIFLILVFSVGALCEADELSDMLRLAELSDFSGQMLVFKEEQEAPLKIWESRVSAHPNTFLWYRWKDYDSAGVWQKPAIFEELKKLTNQ